MMVTFWLLVVAVFAILVAIWGLCAMSKHGDEQLKRARQDLAGPADRERVGL